MNQKQKLTIAAISGMVSSTLPLIMIFTSTLLEESFSWNKNALSDIGISQQAPLFNSALIISGSLNFIFSLGLRSYLEKTRWLKTGVLLLMISSISLALVGIFTENYFIIHAIVALGYLLLSPIGLISIGFEEKKHGIGKASLTLGIAALLTIIALPLVAYSLNLQIGFAIPEYLEALILYIWIFWISLKLLDHIG